MFSYLKNEITILKIHTHQEHHFCLVIGDPSAICSTSGGERKHNSLLSVKASKGSQDGLVYNVVKGKG